MLVITRLISTHSATMQYSNLKNEESTEDKLGTVGDGSVVKMSGDGADEEVAMKRETFWFAALVLTLLLIGSVVFFVAHTGGIPCLSIILLNINFCYSSPGAQSFYTAPPPLPTTTTQTPSTPPARSKTVRLWSMQQP